MQLSERRNDAKRLSVIWSQDNFHGGLNTLLPGDMIADNEFQDVSNMECDTSVLYARKGTRLLNDQQSPTLPAGVCGFCRFTLADGSTQLLCAVADTLYKYNESTRVYESIATFTTGNGDQVFFTPYLGKLWITNGVDPLMSWDGTVFTEHAGTPVAYYSVVLLDRLYLANLANDLSIADATAWVVSETGDPTNFPLGLGYSGVVGHLTGDFITGVSVFDNAVTFYMNNSIYDFYPGEDIVYGSQTVTVTTALGCVAARSIVASPYGTFFLARDGVYVRQSGGFNKVSRLLVGDHIRGVDTLIHTIPQAYVHTAAGCYFKDAYYLSITANGGAYNTIILKFYTLLSAWTKYTGIKASCFWVDNIQTEDIAMFYGDAIAGKTYQMQYGESDNSESITTSVLTKAYSITQPFISMRLLKGEVMTLGGDQVSIDTIMPNGKYHTFSATMATGNAVYGVAIYGTDRYGSARTKYKLGYRYPTSMRGENISFRIVQVSKAIFSILKVGGTAIIDRRAK